MNQEFIELGGAFAPVSLEAWAKVVAKAQGGLAPDEALGTVTDDGLRLRPLYTRADWAAGRSGVPGQAPFTRGASADAAPGWDVRAVIDAPRLADAKAALQAELEGGATSLALRLAPRGVRSGPWGLSVNTLDGLDKLLADVPLGEVPIALDAGAHGFTAAVALIALYERRGLEPAAVKAELNIDPIGAGVDGVEILGLGGLAKHIDTRYPGVTTLAADARVYHAGGASEAQEIGFALATGAAYLRVLESAGLPLERALRQIRFIIATDSLFFRSIAKLRAARLAWGRLVAACGVTTTGVGAMRIWAETAWHEMARRDPYVNMLRGTAAGFAAAIGGAQAISVRPFDEALNIPSLFGRRIARNTQLILEQESGLDRVLDPAGGSWYLESLTEQLAAKAWAIFQEIERGGGMMAALQSGRVASLIEPVNRARHERLARRAEPLTGVSIFPDLAEPMVSGRPADGTAAEAEIPATPRTPDVAFRLKDIRRAPPGSGFELIGGALEAGAGFGQIEAALGHKTFAYMPPAKRLAEPFEALRDASDALARRPRVFLANWGAPRDYLDAAMFACNLFAVAGIEAVGDDGFTDQDAVVTAAAQSGARLVILCTSKTKRESDGVALIKALKGLEPARLYAVGETDEPLGAEGVDAMLADGMNILALLRDALEILGAKLS